MPGTALIEQANQRIAWHKRVASTMETELASLDAALRDKESPAEWKIRSRRTELEKNIAAHLEYARFLTFVRKSLVRSRRYRIGLADMYSLELMPKGSCL